MTTKEQLISDWNAMGNNGAEDIDSVIFINHGDPSDLRIYTNTNGGSNVVIKPDFFKGLTKQTIGYFVMLGCRAGLTIGDSTDENFAMPILKSYHIFGCIVASDMQVWYTPNSTRHQSSGYDGDKRDAKGNRVMPSEYSGKGFKVYKWNYDTGSADITPIGNDFASITDLVEAARKAIPVTNFIPAANDSSKDKGKSDTKVAYGTGTITAISGLNLRQGAGTGTAKLGAAEFGDTFEYYGTEKGAEYTWYRVQMTSGNLQGKQGYLAGAYVNIVAYDKKK